MTLLRHVSEASADRLHAVVMLLRRLAGKAGEVYFIS
jgi:hypothetical protein